MESSIEATGKENDEAAHCANSSTHPLNFPDNDLLYSHVGSVGHHTDFLPASWQSKFCLISGPTDPGISFTNTVPPGNVWKSSG